MKKSKVKESNSKLVPALVRTKMPKVESTPIKYGVDENGNAACSVVAYLKDDPALTGVDIVNERLKEIVSVSDSELAKITLRMASKSIEGYDKTQKENIILQSLHNLKPKDVIEARLITQETVLHSETMKALYFLSCSENVYEAEVRINMLAKLTKLHNETIETLARYRRGGTQTVTVQHAVVDNRAFVNNFTGMGGGTTENKGEIPCSINCAVPKQGAMDIDHVDNLQWPMDVVDSMEGNVSVPLKKADEKLQ